MTPEEIYKKQTGVNAMYRVNGSDWHTLKYVKWLEEQNAKLLEALKLAIIFIPDGFPMPLGWGQVVAQAESAIKEAEGRL